MLECIVGGKYIMSKNIVIMSNNLWDNDVNRPNWIKNGEDCSAKARVDGIVKAYKMMMPDILGFQEMTPHMQWLLEDKMCNSSSSDKSKIKYELVTGGYTMLMYRRDKLRLIESGHYVFEEKYPPYTDSFNNFDSKGYTFAVFEDKENKKKVIVFSTHLWWMSDDINNIEYREGSGYARAKQVEKIIEKTNKLISEYNCPVIVLGDMNDKLGSLPLNKFFEFGFEDTHTLCTGERDDENGYHYCFHDGWKHYSPKEHKDAIDFILIKNAGNTKVNKFLRFTESFFEPLSDHFPVYIDVTL